MDFFIILYFFSIVISFCGIIYYSVMARIHMKVDESDHVSPNPIVAMFETNEFIGDGIKYRKKFIYCSCWFLAAIPIGTFFSIMTKVIQFD